MSGMAALSGGVTSFRPRYSIVSLHSPVDFLTGHMGLLKCERVLLITAWLSVWRISWWMGRIESRFVR